MIFRLSQKLNTKVKAGTLKAMPLDENPYADWSAHLFTADRTQCVLLSNTKSLYSTVFYAKGITHDGQFISRALDCLREFMQDDGQQFAYHRLIAPVTTRVPFAKALDRRVTGSMNELIHNAVVWLTEGDLSPFDVGFKLNEVLISSLPGPDGMGYGRPRETFKAMLPATQA